MLIGTRYYFYDIMKEFYGDNFVYNVAPMVANYPLTANTQEEFDRMNNFFTQHKGELGKIKEFVIPLFKIAFKIIKVTILYLLLKTSSR